MTTIVKPLENIARDPLHQMCLNMFLDGECYAFAIALHQGLGWPIIGLMEGNVIRHALIKQRDALRDARGTMVKEEALLGAPFGHKPPYDLQLITVADLTERRPVAEMSIKLARRLAESIWPELPWKDSAESRATAFIDELEALSRKHGIWIRSPYATTRPLLAPSDNKDEGGYVLTFTNDGVAFTFDRYFKERAADAA